MKLKAFDYRIMRRCATGRCKFSLHFDAVKRKEDFVILFKWNLFLIFLFLLFYLYKFLMKDIYTSNFLVKYSIVTI